MMIWTPLTTEQQLDEIKERSAETPQLIFKHSTRCAISSMAKSRLERAHVTYGIDFYFLDLVKYRTLSNKVETEFMVNHESPQVLLIKDSKCVYDESHNAISMNEIEEQAKKMIS